MSESRAVDTVSGLDYEEIEQAVMETARGRWFLTEFARRQRASDTKILLDAIRRLEDQLLAMPAANSVSSAAGQLVAEAENELHRLSGESGSDPANARALAGRLAAITGNLREAVGAPADTIAERIKPEIERLQACAGEQDELAGKLARAAQLVRRLRSSEAIDDHGNAAEPERQIAAAPAAEPVAMKQIAPSAPAFVPSDDDLFETAPAAAAAPAPAATPAPARAARSLGADTLDFSSIEVPPLPDRVSASDDDEEDASAPADVGPAAASSNAIQERSADEDLKARDRVIQVTRSATANNRRLSDFGPPPSLSTNGRINVGSPVAANQQQSPAAPSTSAPASRPASDASAQKKRIIVIRRPAEGTDGIPLAGE